MFLKAVSALAKENCVKFCTSELVTIFFSPAGSEIFFFPKNVLIKKDASCLELDYKDLSFIKISSDADLIKIESEGKSLEYKTQNLKSETEFFSSLSRTFSEGYESSPDFMQNSAEEFCSVKYDSKKSSVSFLLDLMEENPNLVKSIFKRLNFYKQEA